MSVMRPLVLAFSLVLLLAGPAGAGDIREASRKAAEDRRAAEEAARIAEERILRDRDALRAEVARLETRVAALERSIEGLGERYRSLREREAELSRDWSRKELEFRETVGTIRTSARDLDALLRRSFFTAEDPERLEQLQPLLEKRHFPSIEDIEHLAAAYFEEIERSGEVALHEGTFVDRAGASRQGRVLTIGTFTALYDTGDEVGFLQYAEDARRFRALSALPSWWIRRDLRRYLAGEADAVQIDLSGGGALRQITHRPSPWEHIRAGGPVVWPILAIAVLGLLLVLERVVYLRRVHGNTDRIMAEMQAHAETGDWSGCDGVVERLERKGWPVVNVLAAGLAARGEDRDAQESILQEAILREVPRLERFLSILAIMGAIAPLLGLLGTVTGMIDTFRVITLYGTGDPKMMSGGISEALVTTELGLAVAIPIMLMHTFLSRRVDHIVGDMEEKAVALTNLLQKGSKAHGSRNRGA